MKKYLKGNYELDNESQSQGVSIEPEDDYTTKALNSIGGSMVFVEKNKMIWKGDKASKHAQNVKEAED